MSRDYKYTQEISQMMFVFGEVQDPTPETVNLVEDIVRGQLIELVRPLHHLRYHTLDFRRLFKLVHWLFVEELDIFLLKILYSSFATTEPR